tara:strand:- start:339 stop:932 length:594 start_codon:yes stop_codon:yes gene_type:complete
MKLIDFIKLRPFSYHLTSSENFARIRTERRLRPAIEFIGRDWLRRRRNNNLRTNLAIVRDQAPLHAGSILFLSNWELADLVEHLNNHVFFWPGTESNPITAGKNHYGRYSNELNTVLRIPTEELITTNPAPLFSRYNSGAPRVSGGKYSPRGPRTFLPAEDFIETPGKVKELVFRSSVTLPRNTQHSADNRRSWSIL